MKGKLLKRNDVISCEASSSLDALGHSAVKSLFGRKQKINNIFRKFTQPSKSF